MLLMEKRMTADATVKFISAFKTDIQTNLLHLMVGSFSFVFMFCIYIFLVLNIFQDSCEVHVQLL
ncbi:hypothetical protein DsansV1_C15g0135941 [Dioscorea sansibarensis]